ncbi:hypothetical protein [Lyngbya sp. PCC 8106]|uniref:hypothetical protein n=1 Tax=Lyngbya sp. (strain PCC 8106) TaxID=313612 RepID=UPI0000EAB5F4|nr:hypothetical protein [Lyngbya sp. PCC 8106]EAW36034.1 hypothetical protein L8106_22601 [Lyngbya sp. PCC 8106]
MYKTQAPDTAPEAEQIQFSIWRKIPPEQKTQEVYSFNRRMRAILWQNNREKEEKLEGLKNGKYPLLKKKEKLNEAEKEKLKKIENVAPK